MPTQVTEFKCPACTAPLHFSEETGRLECDYCGSSFSVEEMESRSAEKEQQAAEAFEKAAAEAKADAKDWDGPDAQDSWGKEGTNLKTYSCPSCGAELICDEATAATSCPYCGNNTIIPGQFTGALKPDLVIPFKVGREEALSTLRAHYKGKRLLPKRFSDENHIQEIKGVYVPFWLFDCKADFDYHATGENVITWSDTRFIYTKTDLYHIHRAGTMEFENIPLDASEKMQDDLMDALEPFHLEKKKPFDMSYLSGFLAEKYTYEPKDLYDRMTKRITPGVEHKAAEGGKSYQRVYGVKCHTDFSSKQQSYMLLPVWMLMSKYDGKEYLFAMNGQTGKIVGELPVSNSRSAKWFVIIFCISFVIVMIVLALLAMGGVL